MAKKKTKKISQRNIPIVDPTPETLRMIEDIERRFSETPQQRPCEVCGWGVGVPKNLYTSPDGTRWTLCVVCDEWLHDVDKATRKRARFGLIDEMELMTERLPYFRAWMENRNSVDELDRKVA